MQPDHGEGIAFVSRCEDRGCVHFLENIAMKKVACKAFPNGAPEEIAYGNDLHMSPRIGDGGIMYAQATNVQ